MLRYFNVIVVSHALAAYKFAVVPPQLQYGAPAFISFDELIEVSSVNNLVGYFRAMVALSQESILVFSDLIAYPRVDAII